MSEVRINDDLIEPLAACQLGLCVGASPLLRDFGVEDMGDPERDAGHASDCPPTKWSMDCELS